MIWHRVTGGAYQAYYGASRYRVGKLLSGEWYAEGPNVDAAYPTKAAAQRACVEAAGVRA